MNICELMEGTLSQRNRINQISIACHILAFVQFEFINLLIKVEFNFELIDRNEFELLLLRNEEIECQTKIENLINISVALMWRVECDCISIFHVNTIR